MDVSIVIPIYNAGDIIERAVTQIICAMGPLGLEYEILLRDDGSVDESREILKEGFLQYPQVRCFRNLSNEGLGMTLRKLLNDARGEKVVYCDCDLPFGEKVIPVLLSKLERCDVVVASRYRGALNKTSFTRKICSRVYYFLCRLLFHVPVADIGSGTVAIRRKVLEEIDLKARRFDIHIEFYAKIFRKGFRIEEVPMDAALSMLGSFQIWPHGPQVLSDTIRLYFKLFKTV